MPLKSRKLVHFVLQRKTISTTTTAKKRRKGARFCNGCSFLQWVLVPAIGIEVYDRFLREGRFLRISLTLLWVSRSAPQYGSLVVKKGKNSRKNGQKMGLGRSLFAPWARTRAGRGYFFTHLWGRRSAPEYGDQGVENGTRIGKNGQNMTLRYLFMIWSTRDGGLFFYSSVLRKWGPQSAFFYWDYGVEKRTEIYKMVKQWGSGGRSCYQVSRFRP